MFNKNVTIFWGNSNFIVQNNNSSRKDLCFSDSIINGSIEAEKSHDYVNINTFPFYLYFRDIPLVLLLSFTLFL